MKDYKRFSSFKVEEKYEDSRKPHKLLEEKGFDIPKWPTGILKIVLATTVRLGWSKFCMQPQDPNCANYKGVLL